MRIMTDNPLADFKFWQGAKDRAEMLTRKEFGIIENTLEELYPDGVEEVWINDFFWFDFDTIAQWLGYVDEEDFCNKREQK